MDLMTHDIANYTTPVMAYLDSLLGHPGCDDTERDKLKQGAQFQVENIMRLVDMVRLTERLKGDLVRVTKRTDLGAVLRSVVEQVLKDPHAKPFDAEVALPPGARSRSWQTTCCRRPSGTSSSQP